MRLRWHPCAQKTRAGDPASGATTIAGAPAVRCVHGGVAIPGVFEGGATQQRGMQRRPNAEGVCDWATKPYANLVVMSLGRLRRSTRLVAAILLLASPWQLLHRSADDEICLPSSEAHDASKHVFTADSGAGHAEHCAICHWTRLLKPDLSVRASAALIDHASADLIAAADAYRRDPSTDQLPSRAPPSQLG